jgi:pimeloyl-ACP methyl ester carboxylesterase
MDRTSQQIELRDGRKLGFAEYGPEKGVPILYFHGWPSSRLEASAMEQICFETKVRMIAADRPGFGLSDYHRGRTFLDFTHDVVQLVDNLGLAQFAVLGISGGGPYAAACAFQLGSRLTAVLLVCSMGPTDVPDATRGMLAINRWLLSIARRFPRIAQCLANVCLKAIWRNGSQVIPKQIELRLPPADQQALASRDLREALIAGSVEALRRGVRGAAIEGLLYGRPWGFSLAEIRTPVFLWHGEKDVVVPASMGRYLAQNIPKCQARFYPTDGHFSLPFTRLREILKTAIS